MPGQKGSGVVSCTGTGSEGEFKAFMVGRTLLMVRRPLYTKPRKPRDCRLAGIGGMKPGQVACTAQDYPKAFIPPLIFDVIKGVEAGSEHVGASMA